jgi:peroxiredoxin 2/4
MLKPGDEAPQFDLRCAIAGKASSLSLAKIKSEMIVLFFYPHDFSFICPTEVTGFQHALKQFEAEHASVVGASVDSVNSHIEWARELGGIDYPLLADEGGKLAIACGVFDDNEKVAMRATFILNEKRIVNFAIACPNNVGRSVAETLRIVQAIRTGQLCPADWKPGGDFGPVDRKY